MAPEESARETLAFSLEQAKNAANIALAVALVIALIASREAAYSFSGAWAAAVGITLLARNALLQKAGRRLAHRKGERDAEAALNNSSLILALVIGLLPVFGFPAMSVELKLLLTLFFCCWCAAGMSSLGVTPRLYSAYLAIVLGAVALGWARSGSELAAYIAAGLAMYGLVLRSFAHSFARRIVEGIAIRSENADLVRQLSSANDAKTRFIMAASHDLRQPLHAISLLGGVLSRAQNSDDAQGARDALDAAVKGLNTLFSAILDLSRIESGSIRVHSVPFEIDQLIGRLDAEYRALCVSTGRRWECQVERVTAVTDPVLLERVLRNLLDNAVKHGGHGAIRLGAVPAPGEVVVTVTDAGPGIALEERGRIFEEFYRVNGQGQTGLGLGLSIVRRLVEMLGCRLEVDFTDVAARRGTCVTLRIPAGEMPAVPAEGRSQVSAEPDVEGMRILVLDDEQPVLDATRALLQQWRCKVATCRGTEDIGFAVQSLGPPDVALIDYRLGPDSSGLDVIGVVRAQHPGMGVVVVTGESDASVLARLVESGLPVLEKPVSPDELRLTLALFKSVG